MLFLKRSRSNYGIKHHLVSLVLLTVIPLSIFSAALLSFLADQRTETMKTNLLGTAKTLRVAVDEQILSVTSSLQILAEIEDFGPSRIQYLHSKLRNFVVKKDLLVSIALTDSRGNQVFNTISEFNKPLQSYAKEPFFLRMQRSKEVVISDLRDHIALPKKVISIAVPVLRHSEVIYCLIASIDVSAFAQLLSKKHLPSSWGAVISSEEGLVLATSAKDIASVGSQLQEPLSEDSPGVLFSETQSKLTGWTVRLVVPEDGFLFRSLKPIQVFFLGLLFFCGLSIILALVMGRRIAQPIRALSSSAKRLGEGRSLKPFEASFVEVSDVYATLIQASELRHQSEERIKHLYQEAREAVTIRDTFLSMASHELKTPLTSLKLQFDILERRIEGRPQLTREEFVRPITRVQEQIKRLVLLIDDLLDVSRISSGKLEYHLETFDLVPLAHEIVQQMNGATPTPLISFSGVGSLTGFWDRHRVEQILVNLLSNALKYGKGNPVKLDLLRDSSSALIIVRDQGVGLSPSDLGRIFDKFERVGDRKLVAGLGLGLWIVKKIVEGFSGSISVESQLGDGSTFTVRLPCFAVSQAIPSLFVTTGINNDEPGSGSKDF